MGVRLQSGTEEVCVRDGEVTQERLLIFSFLENGSEDLEKGPMLWIADSAILGTSN